jgi:hypothetical protein
MRRRYKEPLLYFVEPDDGKPAEFIARRVGNHLKKFPFLNDVPPDRAMITRVRDGFTIILLDWSRDSWELPQQHWRDFFFKYDVKLFGGPTQ